MLGISAPWYNDPIEHMAFNLFAMECEESKEEEDSNEEYVENEVARKCQIITR